MKICHSLFSLGLFKLGKNTVSLGFIVRITEKVEIIFFVIGHFNSIVVKKMGSLYYGENIRNNNGAKRWFGDNKYIFGT